jgi:hypothetical protein
MIEIEEKQYMKAKAIFDFITPSACLAFHERGMKRKQCDYNNDYYDDNYYDGDNGDGDSSLALDGIAGTGTIERDRDDVGNSERVEDAATSSESSSSHNNDSNSSNRNNSKNGNNHDNDNSSNRSVNKKKKKKKKKNVNNSTISSIDNNKSKGVGLAIGAREERGGEEIGGDEGVGGIVGVGVGVGMESESLRSLLGFSSFKSSYKSN